PPGDTIKTDIGQARFAARDCRRETWLEAQPMKRSPLRRPLLLLAAASLSACVGPCSAPTQIPEVPTAELPTGSTPRWEGEAALTTGQRLRALDRLPATWTLPTGEHGRSALPPSEFTLTQLRSVTRGGRSWWVQRLPFRLPDSMQRFR